MASNDIAQLNLAEPEKVDWDNAFSGSSYQAPPPALGPDGKPIVYTGIVEAAEIETERPDKNKEGQPVLTYRLDPIKLINTGGKYDGVTLRFTRVSVKPFEKNGQPQKGNPNKLGQYLRATGLAAKPQNNSEYIASVKMSVKKPFKFTLDWEAYNKDTGEAVRGYNAFPDDPERPGQKKSILKQGDFYQVVDNKGVPTGEIKQVQSEVLFANPRLRFFRDPSKGQQG